MPTGYGHRTHQPLQLPICKEIMLHCYRAAPGPVKEIGETRRGHTGAPFFFSPCGPPNHTPPCKVTQMFPCGSSLTSA